jgi:hypothetical protein
VVNVKLKPGIGVFVAVTVATSIFIMSEYGDAIFF